MSSSSIYALILMQTAHPCGRADTEDYVLCIQGMISKMALRWHRGDDTVPKCYSKSILIASWVTIEPLMADGVSWRCFSYFSGPWQCNLLGSQWDSHQAPGSHPKYLKLCSEDEQSFYGFVNILVFLKLYNTYTMAWTQKLHYCLECFWRCAGVCVKESRSAHFLTRVSRASRCHEGVGGPPSPWPF